MSLARLLSSPNLKTTHLNSRDILSQLREEEGGDLGTDLQTPGCLEPVSMLNKRSTQAVEAQPDQLLELLADLFLISGWRALTQDNSWWLSAGTSVAHLTAPVAPRGRRYRCPL